MFLHSYCFYVTYHGKVKRHFGVRIFGVGISALTGDRVKDDDNFAIKEYLLLCNHAPDFEDFSVVTSQRRRP